MKRKNKIEHCSEPKCPECNIEAYKKGWQDAMKYMRVEMIKVNIPFKGKIK